MKAAVIATAPVSVRASTPVGVPARAAPMAKQETNELASKLDLDVANITKQYKMEKVQSLGAKQSVGARLDVSLKGESKKDDTAPLKVNTCYY